MRITQSCYQTLLALPLVPPERGGLLGGRDGTIDTWYLDPAKPVLDRAAYIPDFSGLNHQIARWQGCGIDFMGMFHSHPPEQTELSSADRAYIGEIFAANPSFLFPLFFPVVLPGNTVVPFCAQKQKNGTVQIVLDALTII